MKSRESFRNSKKSFWTSKMGLTQAETEEQDVTIDIKIDSVASNRTPRMFLNSQQTECLIQGS